MALNQPLAIFDVDGTLFRWQLYYAIVLDLRKKGFFSDTTAAEIDRTFHAWESRNQSFNEFEHVAITALTELLPNLSVEDFTASVQTTISNSSHKTYAYTRKLATELKQQGYFLLAVSGSPQEVAQPFVEQYGFNDCIGWIYEQKNGYFTGKITRNTVHDKAKIVQDYVAANGMSLKGSIAVGDSRGDIAMLKIVDQPIAFNPSEELLDEALASNWKIVIERKNIAYSLVKGSDGNTILETTDSL